MHCTDAYTLPSDSIHGDMHVGNTHTTYMLHLKIELAHLLNDRTTLMHPLLTK